MKPINYTIRVLSLGGVAAGIVYLFGSNHVPEALPFKNLTPQAFAGLIAWLFAVALFVERAVEVVVMVFRDQKAGLLSEAETRATETSESTAKAVAALASNPAATQVEKNAAANAAGAARQTLVTAHGQVVTYRAETKEAALLVGFILGILVSLAGVRALRGLLPDNAPTSALFTLADVVVTGAMLAGGSEGVHRIANVFTSFMDSLSTQIDNKQKK